MNGPTAATLQPIMSASAVRESADIHLASADTARWLADQVVASGARWVWIDGYSGSGKSTLGGKLAYLLGWRWVDLDSLLSDQPVDSGRFADHIDRGMLADAMGDTGLRRNVVVSGICLREVLALTGDVSDAFAIYVARVTQPTDDGYIWQDAIGPASDGRGLGWLDQDISRYHQAADPVGNARVRVMWVDGR